MPTNKFALVEPRSGELILEMKLGLVLYLASAPSPDLARAAYDLFMAEWGPSVKYYCATRPGSIPLRWTSNERSQIEQSGFPNLRKLQTWGYGFASGHGLNETLFMIHGSRPSTEAGKASFIRLSLPWDEDPERLRAFAISLANTVRFEWGMGGLYFQKSDRFPTQSMDEMYAKARRYWGIDAHDLDVTLWYALDGLKSVSWLTLIGSPLADRSPSSVAEAEAAAFRTEHCTHGRVFVTEETPRYIDRNKAEPLGRYATVAAALEPLQLKSHGSFGGTRWTDDNTYDYLLRFTTGVV